MKRFLALLLLLLTPAAYGQVDFTNAVNVPNTVVNSNFENCVPGQSNCGGTGWGGWVEGQGFQPGDFTSAFGSREYAFSFVNGVLTQNVYLGNLQTNAFNFFFDFDLNNSCRNSIGGSCTNINGPIDEFSAKIFFYDQNGLNNEFTFLSGTPSTANIVCDLEILGLCLGGYSAQDQWQHFGWYSSVQSNSLFDYARIEFTGRDVGFWGGLYGPRIDNVTLQVNYLPPLYPASGGDAGMNVSAPGSDYIFIYKGNDPVLFSQLAIAGQDLVGWTAIGTNGQDLTITQVTQPDPDYLFLYTDGVPVSGTFYSFQELPPTVDCTLDPFDPTCVIDTLGIDESPVMVADTTDESLPVEEDPAPADELLADDMTEEQLADEEMSDEEMSDEETLEELLAEESDEEETVTEERLVVYRELSDEEKAAILADAISKNTLEAALSVATDAVSSAAATATSEVSLSTESSKSSSASVAISTEISVNNEIVVAMEMSAETTKEEITDSSTASSLDILEVGRQLGQEALATTLAGAESSANESLNEAENIAFNSSNDSVLVSMTSIEIAASIDTEEQQVANNETEEETATEDIVASETTEIMVAESAIETTEQTIAEVQQQEVQEEVKVAEAEEQETTEIVKEQEETVVAEVQPQQTIESVAEQKEEIIVAETSSESSTETVEQVVAEVQTEQQSSAVEFTSVEDVMEAFASNINQQAAAAEQEELENNIVQQAIASSQTNDEDNKMGFAEAEAVTIASDPALANAFNVQPNTASLELLGVLSNKPEEKSDAELRAEQVVAANKEQQEAINANYMEADQSGILVAIGSETDVTSYRTAMIRDNNNWYKPEDIYKGIIIKDNVRGSYFLEKGNTDTYKKMIEEQYK